MTLFFTFLGLALFGAFSFISGYYTGVRRGVNMACDRINEMVDEAKQAANHPDSPPGT